MGSSKIGRFFTARLHRNWRLGLLRPTRRSECSLRTPAQLAAACAAGYLSGLRWMPRPGHCYA
eukprot:2462873-Alexandrium_andersonii.AAC.1